MFFCSCPITKSLHDIYKLTQYKWYGSCCSHFNDIVAFNDSSVNFRADEWLMPYWSACEVENKRQHFKKQNSTDSFTMIFANKQIQTSFPLRINSCKLQTANESHEICFFDWWMSDLPCIDTFHREWCYWWGIFRRGSSWSLPSIRPHRRIRDLKQGN